MAETIDFKRFSRHFPSGRDYAQSAEAMAEHLQIPKRKLSKLVTQCRIQGYIIAGDYNGYYRPASEEESRDYLNFVRKRAETSHSVYNAVRQNYIKNYGEDFDL